jgi:hypothetical protein
MSLPKSGRPFDEVSEEKRERIAKTQRVTLRFNPNWSVLFWIARFAYEHHRGNVGGDGVAVYVNSRKQTQNDKQHHDEWQQKAPRSGPVRTAHTRLSKLGLYLIMECQTT